MITQIQSHFATLALGFSAQKSRESLLSVAVMLYRCIFQLLRSGEATIEEEWYACRLWYVTKEMFYVRH